ncbi:MAG: DUF4140 domain-containing protein, partial [Cyclobacteriaceae bacterium]|nr:DUF4140 domain-containing protein [Cyclobacteriaceae bacterium]MDX5466569.1 DUF4140 domain-containing protein [Cyclobacteriaceae bacterium]
MKKPIFLWILIFCWTQSFSQELKEVKLTNEIESVTLFLSGAQIFEKAGGSIPAGESILEVNGLSPYLDEKSIQVKGQGNFTIQAVNKRLDFLSEKEVDEQ